MCSLARQPWPGCSLLRTCPLPGQRFSARVARDKALERKPSKAPPRGKQAGTGEGWASPMNPAAVRSWRRTAPDAIAPAPSGTIQGKAPTWYILPGRVKLSPKLQPLTIRKQGGKSPVFGFCPKRKKRRQRRKASGARQARRAPPCGQVSAGMGACGQPFGLSICAHVGLACPSGSVPRWWPVVSLGGVWGGFQAIRCTCSRP